MLTVSSLFLILGYLVYYGGRSLNWNFFTKLPLPPGEIGGGMANAIVGSVEIVGVAALIGLPVGFLAGIYLAEFEDKMFCLAGPLRCRSAERHSVHRGGIFWRGRLVVVPMRSFSGFGRRRSP